MTLKNNLAHKFTVRKLLFVLCGVIGFIAMVGERGADAQAQMGREEVVRIQRYFILSPELKLLIKNNGDEVDAMADQFPDKDDEGFKKKYDEIQTVYEDQRTKLFAKHQMTEEEYNKIQTDILSNPGKLQAYVAAGGELPERDDAERLEPLLTPEERLKKEGIRLDPLTEETLEEVLNDSRFLIRLDVINVLGEKQDPVAIPYLREQLNDENVLVRLASAGSLCQMDIFDDVPLVIEALVDPNQDLMTRISAIRTSGMCQKNPNVLKAMLALLKIETNGTLRLHIAMEIDKGGDLSILDELVKIKETEKDFFVRALLEKTTRAWEKRKRIQELSGK